MVVVWYGVLSAWGISLVYLLSNWWWLGQQPEAEPAAAVYGAAATFAFATIALPLQYFFGEENRKKRALKREEKRKVLDWVLDRLDGEMRNFEQIRPGRTYNSPLHQRAIEEYSFELLGNEIEKLLPYFWYRASAKEILSEIKRNKALPPNGKDATRLIPMLNKLRPRVEKGLITLGGPAEA